MRILFFLDFPGVRDYRIFQAIREARPDWDLKILQRFPGIRTELSGLAAPYPVHDTLFSRTPARLWRLVNNLTSGRLLADRLALLARDADWVYTQNFEFLGRAALHLRNISVAHDVSDFFSVFPHGQSGLNPFVRRRIQARWEKRIFERASIVTFNSPEMVEHARRKYSLGGAPIFIPNGYPKSLVPTGRLPKLSASDGRRHIAFVGHLDERKLEPLVRLAALGNDVHAYTHSQQILENCQRAGVPGLTLYPPLENRRLAEVLSQYDYGIVPWLEGAKEEFFQLSLPGKLFDYLAAGLPVLVRPFRALRNFVDRWQCGLVIEDWQQARDLPPARSFTTPPEAWKMSFHIAPLIEAFESVRPSAPR
ncbi:MAG: hypothetical protein EHM23_03380 [Acidobacteria bacterium]|nr:MAG: hypothetical protein EHM23_03380 [Acidobacteriota bacterium]